MRPIGATGANVKKFQYAYKFAAQSDIAKTKPGQGTAGRRSRHKVGHQLGRNEAIMVRFCLNIMFLLVNLCLPIPC